jgi:anaerobic magnesium-protoporphyrin IX monomethyl ester cyclase
MKIKIVEPYDYDPRYEVRSLTPAMGPVLVASLLKQEGHQVEVISEYVTRLDPEELNEAEVVGISINTYNARRGYEIARRVKKPVVFGGFHASLLPEECLQHGDYVIRGDGYPVVQLMEFLSHQGRRINEIPNLVYKSDGRVLLNPVETGVIHGVPDFRLVRDYYKVNLKRLVRIPLLVGASRGCPRNCVFCSIKAIYPDFKTRDLESVIADIKNQVEHRHPLSRFLPRIIWITDDNFSSDKRRAKELLREIANLNSGYHFVIQARADIAEDDELLALMKKANIGVVYMGIESLSQKSLDNFNKEMSVEQMKEAIRRIKRFGMAVHGLFVFGDDEFGKGDGLRVAEFVRTHGLSGLLVQPLIPFPGTPSFRVLKAQGRILHEDWRYYNGNVVFMPKTMTPGELQKEIYDCYRSVYSLSHILKFLFFGPRGFKWASLGEALIRHSEWRKKRNYIRDKLSGQGNGL